MLDLAQSFHPLGKSKAVSSVPREMQAVRSSTLPRVGQGEPDCHLPAPRTKGVQQCQLAPLVPSLTLR